MRKKRYGGKVLSFWSWNGDMNLFEIREQLADFAAGHFDGVIVHSRAGLAIEYLRAEWFSAFSLVLKEAEKLGLDVYIYDEDGWPSGFAGGLVTNLGEEYWIKGLRYSRNVKEADFEKLVAAYKEKSDGSMELIPNEQAQNADLVFWYKTDSHYVDLMSEKTVRAFIDCTHEEYKKRFSKYFGTVIKGIFTDEPQLDVIIPWSFELEQKFKDACGYDLIQNLWLLVQNGDGYQKFRNDFYNVTTNAFYNAFTKQIGDWCEENNLLMTGHFPCEDGVCGQIAPCGSVMKHYTAMQFPGIDHLGNMQHSPVLLKQVSSVSQQFSNAHTLSEVFGCSGWEVPLSRLAWIWGRHSALGITTACCHLSAYTIEGIRKRDYPAFFSYQNIWWQDFKALKKWMANLNELMCAGERETQIALLSPLHFAKTMYEGKSPSFALKNCSGQFRQTLQNLIDLQLDAEIADEELLAEYGCVEDGMLRLGKRTYKYLIVPECESIRSETLNIIKQLSAAGLRVIFINKRPSMVDFEASDCLDGVAAIDCCNRVDFMEKCIKHYKIEDFARLLNSRDMSILKNFTLHTVNLGEKRRIHISSNNNFDTVDAVIALNGKCSLDVIDIQTKKKRPIGTKYANGKSYAEITLHSMENVVLETKDYSEDVKTRELLYSVRMLPQKISATEPNCYTIDKAYYVADGKRSEVMPVINMASRLYALANPELSAEVCYTFNVAPTLALDGIKIAVEDRCIDGISVNGTDISDRKGEWWLDKCIHEYDTDGILKAGENTVTVKYSIVNNMADINVKEVFETERNRFFYPKEPESIYIKGNFDVAENCTVEEYPNYYRLQNPDFTLTDYTAKEFDEFTHQGLWFYRGGIEYEFDYEKPKDDIQSVLRIENSDCAAFRVKIGKEKATVFASPLTLDITKYLKDGVNRIRIEAVGNNRNLMGPHHHVNGRMNFVGVNTFKGEYGFEDFANVELIAGERTWDDAYSFIKLDFGKVYIDQYSKED